LLRIVFEDMEILGGLAISVQERKIKGVVDFQKREVFELFP
jgi:hypothetical protein